LAGHFISWFVLEETALLLAGRGRAEQAMVFVLRSDGDGQSDIEKPLILTFIE
jgi:hypothetical protein